MKIVKDKLLTKQSISGFDHILESCSLNLLIGSGASHPNIQTLGNLEEEIQKLLIKKDAEGSEGSIEKVNAYFKTFNDHIKQIKIPGPKEIAQFNKKVSEYQTLLESIKKILNRRPASSKRMNIFTTNYDLFIEFSGARINELVIQDGFDRSSSINHSYAFNTANFYRSTMYYTDSITKSHEIPTINLIKLHGSLNWILKDKNVFNEVSLSDIQAIERIEDLNSLKKGIVLPLKEKFIKTLIETTYYDLLRIFSSRMEQKNSALIAFGFSFKDEHILEITKRALLNPSLSLIIVCHKPSNIADFESKFNSFDNVTCVSPEDENHEFNMSDFISLFSI